MKKRTTCILALLLLLTATAVRAQQMELAFSGIEVTTQDLADGATLVEFPLATDLSTVMQTVSVSVDGQAVDNDLITPNPATLELEDDQVVVLCYDGTAYTFHFSEGKYFTAVILSDPHIEHTGHDATTVADMQAYVATIANMGWGGTRFTFDSFEQYVPQCDLVLSLGDMDEDSKTDATEFCTAHSGFNANGIPFITLLGNHDIVPDYWTGSDPDEGLTFGTTGGSACNDAAFAVVEAEADTAQMNGIENYQQITDGTSHKQAKPFTFTFDGVRFYCGQTYWFQKPYEEPTIWTWLAGTTTYYAPDGVIDSLESFVQEHADEPSVWVQHYPFVAGSDCNRWWLDQNDYGLYIATTDESEYGTDDADVEIYTESSAIAIATKKKDKLAEIINLTTNPVHFSGHTHVYATNTYQGITDYTVAATGYEAGAAYIVLLKGNKGVVEVKKAYFDSDLSTSVDDVEQTILDTSDDNREAALLDKLPAALANIGLSGESIDELDSLFADYRYQFLTTDTIDLTALLGENADFESEQGTLVSPFTYVYPQTGWNEHYSYFSTEGNVAYYYAQQNSSVPSASQGEYSLYLRARWQDQTCREQVIRQTALPSGDYTLSFYMKRAGTLTDNLCYVAVGEEQTTYTPTTAWKQFTQAISLDQPALLTLSFGFTGGLESTESALYVDDIQLTALGTQVYDDIRSVDADQAAWQGTTYTLSGQRLDTTPSAPGIYIIDGKKVLVK